jgi:hypothetical protein
MNFLSPMFLVGLPLVAAPFIIHLFSRQQRDVVRWAAMEFLLSSNSPRRRFMRLKDLLLMLLRMAALLAIIAALARPMISLGWLGSTGPRDVVLVLDNSMSTARKVGTATVFERELDEATRLIGQLNAVDTIRVLLTSPVPEWLTETPQSADSGAQQALIASLRQLTPNQGGADMPKAVHAAMKGEPSSKDAVRFITVITDSRARSWRAESTAEWTALSAMVKQARPPMMLRAVMADDGSHPVYNLAVEKLLAARPVAGVGQPVALTATVKNTGAVAGGPVSLAWSADGQSLGLSAVPGLAAGAETTVTLSQPFANPGLLDIAARLPGNDDLSLDDSAHFLLDVSESIPVLLVEGETQGDPMQSDSTYFLAALGLPGGAPSGARPAGVGSIFLPKLINYQNLAAESLASYQCVVLANVPQLSDELVQKLTRFVNAGGGLWMALGDQTEIAAFNRAFYQFGSGLSPVSLGQPMGDAANREKFTLVAPPSPDHPAMTLLADTHRLDIDRVRIYRRHQFDIGNDKSVSVLLRGEGGAGLVVAKNIGRGRVMVQAVPLNPSWSNIPLCHAFVVMVHEWLWYLTESGLTRRNLQPGETLQAARAPGASNGGAAVASPEGGTSQVVGREEQGRTLFRYSKTLLPGLYTMKISGEKQAPEKFWVNRDPQGSDFTPLDAAQMASLRDTAGVGFGPEPFSQSHRQQERVAAPPKALASWLLITLLVLLVGETLMAFWMDRQRLATPPPANFDPAIPF